jgi:hypothetical protein
VILAAIRGFRLDHRLWVLGGGIALVGLPGAMLGEVVNEHFGSFALLLAIWIVLVAILIRDAASRFGND